MNRTTPRKRKLVEAGNEAADRLLALLGHCEFCKRDNLPLCQHEISRGPNRLTARLEPCASIVVCPDCHSTIHDLPKRQQVLVGLAILYHSRGHDFNLKRFHEIECPHAPNRYERREVELWIARITQQPTSHP